MKLQVTFFLTISTPHKKMDFKLYNTVKGKCFIFINNPKSVICEHFLVLFYRIYKSLMN